MGPKVPSGHGYVGRLCLERQILRQSVPGRLCYHGDQMERSPLLWPAGQAAPDQCWGARMKSAETTGRVRCAIYTRVSTDQGLRSSRSGLAVMQPINLGSGGDL